jgi:hypothetical protein
LRGLRLDTEGMALSAVNDSARAGRHTDQQDAARDD